MTIPNVRVMGITFEHVLTALLDAIPVNGAVEGETLPVILLNPSARPPQQKLTSLHEVVHTMDDRLGIGLGEMKVRRVSAALFQVLRDNPEWLDWIQEEGKP